MLVAEYSSTGGGHTKRMLEPIRLAVGEGKALKRGDTIVLLMPPRSKHDSTGSKTREAHDYLKTGGYFDLLGLNVVIVQSDKTITGLYKPGGASDNVAMLRDLVYKPRRDNAKIRSSMKENAKTAITLIQGYSAKNILEEVKEAVGAEFEKKIMVLGDMAPFLQKAAADSGIEKRVEIGNHQGLFVGAARDYLDTTGKQSNGSAGTIWKSARTEKNLAFVAKASSAGLPTQLALIDYNTEMNVLQDLAKTLTALGITETTTMKVARETVVTELLASALDVDWNGKTPQRAGIIKGGNIKTAADVKGMVYLYVNDYTESLVAHINAEIKKGTPGYADTLFAVCAGGAFKKEKENGEAPKISNLLHAMYAATANGVTSAGFGTTSEFNFLRVNGSESQFVVAPVENQHEQEANGADLVAISKGSAVNARGMGEMRNQLDQLVRNGVTAKPPSGDMEGIVKAVQSTKTNAGHAADLLGGGDARHTADAAVKAMILYEQDSAAKQARRMYKLLVPALDAIIYAENSHVNVRVRVTSKVDKTEFAMSKVIKMMTEANEPAGSSDLTGLLGLEITNKRVKEQLVDFADDLRGLMAISSLGLRKAKALELLTHMANYAIALGW